MKVIVVPSRRQAARAAAELLARLLRGRGEHTLVLASGTTMIPVYRELGSLCRRGRAPFRRARVFDVDELRVAPRDPRSFASFLRKHLVSRVRLPSERVHFLRGDAADPIAECRRFERELSRGGPPDVVVLGLGVNGHVAYLEPGRALPPRTSLVRLAAATRRGLAADGIRPVPREALTMGIETILACREILLVATGRRKATVVAAALEGPITPACPASFLSVHPRLTVVLDRAAASGIHYGTSLAHLVAKGETMPDKETLERARRDKEEGKAPSTQAGEFVREEIEHVREGKHGARSTKQAIAIGLSKARRAGVRLPPPKKGTASADTRRKASQDIRRGKSGKKRKTSARRSRATSRALKREGRSAASKKALARQARNAAVRRGKSSRSRSARKAASARKRK